MEKVFQPCNELTEEKLAFALSEARKKIDANLDVFETVFPAHSSVNNVYAAVDHTNGCWTQGFWTGILWLTYDLTGDEKYRRVAEKQVLTFKERIEKHMGVDHHDMGFLYTPSCVAAYKLTGNEDAKAAAIMAADNLMRRYQEKGEFLQAWGEFGAPENYRLIIDCLLNIPLLYWASEVTGDKKYEEIAFKHFKTTAKVIMREDNSTFHTYYFDPETGAPTKGVTAQGYSDGSCWARGQAWGIYGPMMTYMYKKNPEAIEFFKRASDYFLSHLPEDFIAYWDMVFTSGDEERDSSAAAIAACGLIEGAVATGEEKYMNAAKNMVNSLIDGYLANQDPKSNGILLHGVYTKPGKCGVDECNIWGDYFYMEALARLIKGRDFRAYW